MSFTRAALLERKTLRAAQRSLRQHSTQDTLAHPEGRRRRGVAGAPGGNTELTVSVWGPEEWGQDAPTMAMLTEPTTRQQQQQGGMGRNEAERPGPIWRSIFGGALRVINYSIDMHDRKKTMSITTCLGSLSLHPTLQNTILERIPPLSLTIMVHIVLGMCRSATLDDFAPSTGSFFTTPTAF